MICARVAAATSGMHIPGSTDGSSAAPPILAARGPGYPAGTAFQLGGDAGQQTGKTESLNPSPQGETSERSACGRRYEQALADGMALSGSQVDRGSGSRNRCLGEERREGRARLPRLQDPFRGRQRRQAASRFWKRPQPPSVDVSQVGSVGAVCLVRTLDLLDARCQADPDKQEQHQKKA